MKLHDGTDDAIGGYAATLYFNINSIAELAKADVRVVSRSNDPRVFEEAFAKRLMRYAVDHYMEPVPGGVAHCAARPGNAEDLKKAKCLQLKARVPAALRFESKVTDYVDFAFSGASPCLECDLCICLQSNQRVLDAKLDVMEEAVALAPTAASKADRNATYMSFRDKLEKLKKTRRRN